jgi:hypothetical protein
MQAAEWARPPRRSLWAPLKFRVSRQELRPQGFRLCQAPYLLEESRRAPQRRPENRPRPRLFRVPLRRAIRHRILA